jgi:hypothetical protein
MNGGESMIQCHPQLPFFKHENIEVRGAGRDRRLQSKLSTSLEAYPTYQSQVGNSERAVTIAISMRTQNLSALLQSHSAEWRRCLLTQGSPLTIKLRFCKLFTKIAPIRRRWSYGRRWKRKVMAGQSGDDKYLASNYCLGLFHIYFRRVS